MHTPPEHTCVPRQHELQPHNLLPAEQTLVHAPKAHTWPQGQPDGHEAATHAKWVMSVASRAQVRPVGQVPTHCPPQPSPWPQVAVGPQFGTHTHEAVEALHANPVGHRVPVPHEGPPGQTLEMVEPHATESGEVAGHIGMHSQRPPEQS